jgi:hypothetical protein
VDIRVQRRIGQFADFVNYCVRVVCCGSRIVLGSGEVM